MLKGYSVKIVTATLTMMLIGSGVKPFIEANSLGSSLELYLYLGVICGLAIFNLKWFIEVPLQWLFFLMMCHRYFPSNLPFSVPWVKEFLLTAVNYLDPVKRAEFQFLPANIALIFIGLFLMMLVKLIMSYELWMLPFLAVLSYLLILTVFNGTDHLWTIVRLLVSGLLLSMWLGNQGASQLDYWRQRSVAILILISCLILAWQLPKWLPQAHQALQMQTQPLRSKIRSQAFYGLIEFAQRNGQSATTGFSENDSVLGGSVIPNDELVFIARQTTAHYWKVENKDRYTGHGWEASETARQVISQETSIIDEGHTQYQETGQPIELTLPNPLRYVPKPQGLIVWELPSSYRDNQALEFNPERNRFYVNLTGTYAAEKTLSYEYFPPDYTVADLQGSPARGAVELESYLQLPENLPERVGALARQLTAESSTDYDAVKSLERYLKGSAEFRYSMEEAEVVPRGRDYVDFFLFDSQVGYCEHFSSSMVVLARSLGIPARWAKGFSEGRRTGAHEDGTSTYRITNENAHAWPEIYFQEIGWVPFEPTKSFISSEQVSLTATNYGDSQEILTSSQAPIPSSTSSDQSQSSSGSLEQEAESPSEKTQRPLNAIQWKQIAQVVSISLAGLSLVGGLVFRRQLKWYWWTVKLRYYPNYAFFKAYEGMLTLLEQEEGRHPSETIRHYQERLTQMLPVFGEVFKELTDQYEESIYGGGAQGKPLREVEQVAFYKMKAFAQQLAKEKPGKAT